MVTLLLTACTGASPSDTGGAPEPNWVEAYLSRAHAGALDSVTDSDTQAETGDTDTGAILDADGDGHLAEADGGDDCDDNDARVYPGAEDWCTETDEDCDGVAIDPGRCSDTQGFASRGRFLSEKTYLYMIAVRDLTGDGLDDLLVSATNGAFGISPGDGTWAGFSGWPILAEWAVPGGCSWDEIHVDVGDLDGDGYNDLAVTEAGCQGGYEIAWGPFDGSDPTPPTTWWEGPSPSGFLLEQRVADVDGDGHPDLLGATPTGDEWDGINEGTVYFGGKRTEDIATITADHRIIADMDNLGDLDGDGLDDLLYADGYGEGLDWIPGASLPRGAAVTRDDVVHGTFVQPDSVDIRATSPVPHFLPVGDWSGDGSNDLVYVDELSHRGAILYYDDFTTPEVVPTGIVLNDDVVEHAVGAYPGLIRQNGVPEILFLANNTSELEQYILLPDEWHSGTENLSEVRHFVVGDEIDGEQVAGPGYAWGLGDVDGDGWSDIPVFGDDEAYYLTSFADVPWDEPTYW